MKTFELTEDHIKLLSNFWIEWGDGDYGAPAVDPKRPYGNGDVEADICRILGWFDYTEASDEEQETFFNGEGKFAEMWTKAQRLHKETETALQVVLQFKTFEPGSFVQPNSWEDWERA